MNLKAGGTELILTIVAIDEGFPPNLKKPYIHSG
jgi:hypothetical protein